MKKWIIGAIIIILLVALAIFSLNTPEDTREEIEMTQTAAIYALQSSVYCADRCPTEMIAGKRLFTEECYDSCFEEANKILNSRVIDPNSGEEVSIESSKKSAKSIIECSSKCKIGSHYDKACIDPCV